MNGVFGLREPTGERFIPEVMGGQLIDAEHQARYRFALPHVAERRILDAGCGVGWGSKLLTEAGAAEVVGLDISAKAIAACNAQQIDARFVQGDLQRLPFDDSRFDVVVCFEALEHTANTGRTLDELVRVLAPGGLIFVSSPNPAVYPSGNPFHAEELPPEELRAAVARRLRNTALFRQHQMLSSLICPDHACPDCTATRSFAVHTYSVTELGPGHDPFSVVVASDGALPELSGFQTLVPSTQLDELGSLAAVVSEEREALRAEQVRMAGQWSAAESEREELHQRLRDAGETIRSLLNERDEALQAVSELGSRIHALTQQLERQRLVAANAAVERDEIAMRLITAQQRLAEQRSPFDTLVDASGLATLHERLDEVSGRAAHSDAELAAIRATLSWRVTRPLRTVRKVIGPASGG